MGGVLSLSSIEEIECGSYDLLEWTAFPAYANMRLLERTSLTRVVCREAVKRVQILIEEHLRQTGYSPEAIQKVIFV